MLEDSESNIAKNREYLAARGIEYSTFEPTATGLRKSIIDATQPVRTHFELTGFHDYSKQGKGPAHKVVKDAYFITQNDTILTKVSLYRPKTKDGDPRMWFSNLPRFAQAGERIAIVIQRGAPYLFLVSNELIASYEHPPQENLSQANKPLGIEENHDSTTKASSWILASRAGSTSPKQESGLLALLDEYTEGASETSQELLGLLRELAKTPIPATTTGSTAIGMSIEAALGIPPNSSKQPDYKGIELKSGRSDKNRTNLFAQVADWELSTCKSSAQILDQYGYARDKDFRLYCTISTKKPNSQGLQFVYDEGRDLLEEIDSGGQQVAAWPGRLLRERLQEKHRETFWIQADSIQLDGEENFLLRSVIHTRSPLLNQLMPLISSGVVTMDHLIKRKDGRVSEKGPLFKLAKANLKLLFPTPISYDLASNH